MDREPDRGRVALGSRSRAPAIRRQQQPVSGCKLALPLLALDEEARGAGHDKHPLVVFLIVPLSFGGRLAGRRRFVDTQARKLAERLPKLPGERLRWKATIRGFRLSAPPPRAPRCARW